MIRSSLGPYRLLAALGHGGMADVYLATRGGVRVRAFFLEASRKNAARNPGLVPPSSEHAPRPAKPLTEGAATPPNDGFFDPSARYLGPFATSTTRGTPDAG